MFADIIVAECDGPWYRDHVLQRTTDGEHRLGNEKDIPIARKVIEQVQAAIGSGGGGQWRAYARRVGAAIEFDSDAIDSFSRVCVSIAVDVKEHKIAHRYFVADQERHIDLG